MRIRYVIEFDTSEDLDGDALAELQARFNVQAETLSDGDLDSLDGRRVGVSGITSEISEVTTKEHKVWAGEYGKAPLMFKHEDEVNGEPLGPLWILKDGKRVPYAESGRKLFNGSPAPKWFTLREVQKIAIQLDLELEEV